MSYCNVVGGKLKLKGKALDVRPGGMKKKKKKKRDVTQAEQLRLLLTGREAKFEETADETVTSPTEAAQEGKREGHQKAAGELGGDEGGSGRESRQQQQTAAGPAEDHRTAAEKKYHEQKAKLEAQRLSKVASKSHRQRVEEFNQYLANLSEHYDIPKVGPG